MRFLIDECSGPKLAQWLRSQEYEVFSVYEEARGMSDDEIIRKAFSENWVLITNDKDFGEKVYRGKFPHKGVVLLRLEDERSANKINVMKAFLDEYNELFIDHFIVITEKQIRFAKNR